MGWRMLVSLLSLAIICFGPCVLLALQIITPETVFLAQERQPRRAIGVL